MKNACKLLLCVCVMALFSCEKESGISEPENNLSASPQFGSQEQGEGPICDLDNLEDPTCYDAAAALNFRLNGFCDPIANNIHCINLRVTERESVCIGISQDGGIFVDANGEKQPCDKTIGGFRNAETWPYDEDFIYAASTSGINCLEFNSSHVDYYEKRLLELAQDSRIKPEGKRMERIQVGYPSDLHPGSMYHTVRVVYAKYECL